MTLRQLIFAVVGTLSLFLVIVAGMSASEAWTKRGAATAVNRSNQITDVLLAATRDLIEERDLASILLQAPDMSDASTRAALVETRGAADSALLGALEQVRSSLAFAERDERIAAIQDKHEKIAALRVEIDKELSRAGSGAASGAFFSVRHAWRRIGSGRCRSLSSKAKPCGWPPPARSTRPTRRPRATPR